MRINKHQNQQKQAEGYYWYEAVFLDKKEVEKIFSMVSDGYPKYEIVPDGYHVTPIDKTIEGIFGTAEANAANFGIRSVVR